MEKQITRFTSWLKKQNAAFFFSILFILFSLYFLITSFDYPYHTKFGIGPGFFPRWVSILAVITGILYLLSSVTREKFSFEDAFPGAKGIGNVLLVVASIVLFTVIAPYTGFVIAGSLMLFSIFIKQYTLSKSIIYAILITVICFLIFKKAFSVPLPVNAWGF